MKNKLILSALTVFMATSLNALSLFSNEEDNHINEVHKEIVSFFNNDSFFSTPYHHYKLNLSTSYPKMNVFDNEKSYKFEFELAGMDKKDIKVTITDQNILTVTGVKKEISKEEKKDLIRQEQFYGKFSRSVSLPDDIDSQNIDLDYNNGILKIIVAKDMKKIKKEIRTLSID